MLLLLVVDGVGVNVDAAVETVLALAWMLQRGLHDQRWTAIPHLKKSRALKAFLHWSAVW